MSSTSARRDPAASGVVLGVLAVLTLALASPGAFGQAPFLEYDFETGGLGDFYNPMGMQAISLCEDGIVPAGEVVLDDGEALFTNDTVFGVSMLLLHPDTVESSFPEDSRDYTVRVAIKLESVNEISLLLRTRMKLNEEQSQIDALYERAYSISILAEGNDAEFPDGLLGIAEFTDCHNLIEHPEWVGAAGEGFARVAPPFPISAGQWYWLEATVQGDDDGGPVLLAAKLWPEGEEPPAGHMVIVTDLDGLDHIPETLDPVNEAQVAFGVSFDFDQQPGATCRIDNLTVTEAQGCPEAPLTATRELWGDTILAEGRETALYEPGTEYEVRIALSDVREEGACAAPTDVHIVETVPPGWIVSGVSHDGVEEEGTITWDLNLQADVAPLTYTVNPSEGGHVAFQGEITETAGGYLHMVAGSSEAASSESLPPVSDFGSIQHWLILGSFLREVPGAAPGEAELARDYLTDGDLLETDIQPKAGDTIEPDYMGDAASTGLAPNSLGRNPDDIPTWIEWRDYDDLDDRIDFESIYGDQDDVMCYALTYIHALADVTVNFGVSSDDSIYILLDGKELHKHNGGRTALDRSYMDTPLTHANLKDVTLTEGWHTLVVKVFEGGGEHNFRFGFVDELGLEIPGGDPDVEISLTPGEGPSGPMFRRGDANSDESVDITDGINILNYLFLGGETPSCLDAADTNDSGDVDITDAIFVLNYLFLGGEEPPAPGPGPDCGVDMTEDSLVECVYAAACP